MKGGAKVAKRLVNYLSNNDRGVAAIRHLAAELITEATDRGDLDHATVTWAVNRLLQVADRAAEFDKERNDGAL